MSELGPVSLEGGNFFSLIGRIIFSFRAVNCFLWGDDYE